jgi:energy-coupling factor transporter ATP-binding protein EcfA2
MNKETFEVLLLVGRPASGKSEIIDFLNRLPEDIRRERYHLGRLDVLDDFPMLWTWFEEDDILSNRLGRPRLHSDAQGYFLHPSLWHLLIERLDLEARKLLRDDPATATHTTTLVEFSRGIEADGYAGALPHLGDDLLRRAAALYVNVSFSESLRKNRRRFNPERPDSILEHALSDEKLEKLYRQDDWAQIAPGSSGFIEVRDIRLPYTVFENEDDVTTGKADMLALRLETALGKLWELRGQSK